MGEETEGRVSVHPINNDSDSALIIRRDDKTVGVRDLKFHIRTSVEEEGVKVDGLGELLSSGSLQFVERSPVGRGSDPRLRVRLRHRRTCLDPSPHTTLLPLGGRTGRRGTV